MKSLKRILALALATFGLLTVTACNNTAEIPDGPNYKRTLSNNPNFISYAYSSINDGTTEIKGLDWCTGRSFITLEKFKEYKECGFDVIMPQSLAVDQESWDLCLNLAYQAGLKVLINDGRIYQGNSADPYVINGKTYSRDIDLDYDVQQWLSCYMNHPAFYGVMMGDEVHDYELDGSYGRLYQSVRRVLDKNGLKNAVIHANIMDIASYSQYRNHNPESRIWTEISREEYCEVLGWNVADYENVSDATFYDRVEDCVTSAGAKSRDYQMELSWRRYGAFCEKFFEKTKADRLQIDWYPLYDNAVDYMITTLQVAADVCTKYDARLECVAQSNRYITTSDGDPRGYTENDMRWMNDIMLGFGVKSIMYFCYYVHPDDNNGYFLESCSFLTWYGEKTELWYFMQEIIAENETFALVFTNFTYKASKKYAGDSRQYRYGYFDYAKDCGEFTALQTADVNKEAALITELYDKKRDTYMYAVMNMVDPIDRGSSSYETITLTFDTKYDYAVIWKQGEKQQVAMKNHTLKVENAAGEVTYVIPYFSRY